MAEIPRQQRANDQKLKRAELEQDLLQFNVFFYLFVFFLLGF